MNALFFFSSILTNKNRYLTGISQLDIAAQQVGIMQEQLIALEPKLKVASEIVSLSILKVKGFAIIMKKEKI